MAFAKKAALVVTVGAGAALAFGAPAMAAAKQSVTLKANKATVKVSKEITLHGKFSPERKKVTYVAVLKTRDAKGHWVPAKGVVPRRLSKAGTFTFDVKAAKHRGAETFEVVIDRVKGAKVTVVATSKPVTVKVVK
ncbi:hypothetical protein [Actinoallomurus sp. NPDC050550]|uniref:hypothetical protein n=1 Tax=Actinoallomurus sp. NPDC050550 TaxID=3154937 RepID=UPI0033FC9BDB